MNLAKTISVIISATMLSACSGRLHSPSKLENDHDCKPLYVKVGEKIVISLDSNPSTGYDWLLVNQPDFLTQLDTKRNIYQNQSSNAPLGKPSKSIWYYQINAKGTGQLQFNYQRPWQQQIFPEFQFNCQIISR
ncbi:MAG: protease inhibitor I42 family protein [Candidatus Schmidhempelia sp.]|nr:protease inhibitor I42 family protein [Candidatus Schmidhempelia sp.]